MSSDYLAEKQAGSLYGGWLTKFQHIERLGHADVFGLLDGEVIVQDKMDGANLTVACDPEKGLLVASRNNVISVDGQPATGFNGAIEYVLDNPTLCSLAREGYILRGEWAVRHSITYRPDVYRHFYVFDVQRREDMSYVPFDTYLPLLGDNVRHIPPIARLTAPAVDQLTALTAGPDCWGAEQKEGIVIKRYDYLNKWGRTVWAKMVSADFRTRNKLEFGATRQDGPELKYASSLTREDIMKVVHKIADERGEVSVRNMQEVLGRVWSDHWDDRMWAFVEKGKVKAFDFSVAKRLVMQKAREIALAHFNGVEPRDDSKPQAVEAAQ